MPQPPDASQQLRVAVEALRAELAALDLPEEQAARSTRSMEELAAAIRGRDDALQPAGRLREQ